MKIFIMMNLNSKTPYKIQITKILKIIIMVIAVTIIIKKQNN